jgi:glycosyltransferase involved in cell wall biosynthesis
MPTCAFLSFRLGGTDGVSVVAREWMRAFRSFGFEVCTIAGDGPVDRTVRGLEIGATAPPSAGDVHDAIRRVDLVVVENLLTIPMNLPASRVVARALRGRPALLHHHDPPWQRERYRDVTALPVDDPAWRHVTVNRLTARQLRERGIDATAIYNGFDTDPPRGDRDATRAQLCVAPDERLVVHPVRAIARKDIPTAIELARRIGATYWLTGPAEEGFGSQLARLLDDAGIRVIHRPVDSIDDLYAAADLVAFPSVWEGFGNPPVEASIRERPVVVGRYPVLDELVELGFRWLGVDDAERVEAFVRAPDPQVLADNRAVAIRWFSRDRMAARLHTLLDDTGWTP